MVIDTLTSPVILFFLLGAFAAFIKSDLSIPESFAKAMSIYLMASIGIRGGVEVASSGLSSGLIIAGLTGAVLSIMLPLPAYGLLTSIGKLNRIDAGAVAAHYGSVSVVTFVTAREILGAEGIVVAGYMVAVLAVMETPAIITGLLLARGKTKSESSQNALLHDVFANASVILLVGSFVIGLIAGPEGFTSVKPLFDTGFRGVLCLFLLDMGLIAVRRLTQTRKLTVRLGMLAILIPIANGLFVVTLANLLGLDVGAVAALGVLAGSASYIAVPAAMRLALPEADPGIYLSMSLGITFPFKIVFGISLYGTYAQWLG
jgi:uncharacterized protein